MAVVDVNDSLRVLINNSPTHFASKIDETRREQTKQTCNQDTIGALLSNHEMYTLQQDESDVSKEALLIQSQSIFNLFLANSWRKIREHPVHVHSKPREAGLRQSHKQVDCSVPVVM